jgi:hypothetical protein
MYPEMLHYRKFIPLIMFPITKENKFEKIDGGNQIH